MSLDQLVNVQVSVSSVSPAQAGFGVPLVLAFHLVGVGGALVRSYSGMQDVIQDGHAPTSAVYLILQEMFSQRPRPPVIKVGRRQTAWRQTIDLTPQVLVDGYTYTFTVDNLEVEYTVGPTRGRAVGTAGPWALTHGQTLIATVDGGGPVTATFNGTPAVLANNDGTADLTAAATAAEHLDISVNGTPLAPIVFDGTENTAAEYLSRINTGLGAVATMALTTGNGFTITTARGGNTALIEVRGTSSPALLTILGLTGGQAAYGGGNVANIGAVTMLEFQSLMGAALGLSGGALGDGSNRPIVESATTGGGSSVTMGGTARATMGFDTATHTGSAITLGTVCAGIAEAINSLAGAGCTADGSSNTHVRCTALSDGRIARYARLDPDALHVTDVSPAASVVADLNAVIAADATWYGLVVDAQSQATIQAVAPIIETQRRIYVSDTNDTDVTEADIDSDVGTYLRDHEYARTFLQYHQDVGCYSAAGLLSGRLTATPGSDTWAYKRITGVRACDLTTQVQSALRQKQVNFYVNNGGVGDTLWGVSSAGEYMDIVRGVDWFIATIQQRQVALFRTNPKVPYTDAGIASIGNEIDAVFDLAESDQVRLLTPGTRDISLPKAADMSSSDRQTRVLNGVEFSGTLQGAIHQLNIQGVLAP